MLHRDVKSANLLLRSDGGLKLADFGIAATLGGASSHRNTTIGTPHFMAPEVIQGAARSYTPTPLLRRYVHPPHTTMGGQSHG